MDLNYIGQNLVKSPTVWSCLLTALRLVGHLNSWLLKLDMSLSLCALFVSIFPGLPLGHYKTWTMDWTVDWTMDWAFLIEMSCLTVSWFAAWPRIETWAHN